MWRLKQFIPKDQGTLEGKSVDVGALKLQVRSTIAQGGFSCVYLARDAGSGRSYALKHIICNDAESVDLVKSEVSVMKALRGHPNVVMLHGQVVYDMGRTKECFLAMDYCDKMLVHVLENRGAGYFDEKQMLLIFRDVCNAVYAMHCQSPPVAHRDLKAENVLMGSDGLWKLCDFGSTSTNHKRFEKPDEMGIEEDIIRKHTTPGYRAPEMWDLFRRELISEKVDIWALGCLLYRIAYLKPAFDGESKLQILNGNYRIPDAPRYSAAIADLIRDMLTANPEARPDVMQVWRRANELLPTDVQKPHPDKVPSSSAPTTLTRDHSETRGNGLNRGSPVIPSRSPPLPPPAHRDIERKAVTNGVGSIGAGAFWSTPYAQNSQHEDTSGVEKAGANVSSAKLRSGSPLSRSRREIPNLQQEQAHGSGNFLKKNPVTNLIRKVQGSVHGAGSWRDDSDHNGYEMRLESEDHKLASDDESKAHSQISSPKISAPSGKSVQSNNAAFNEFAAHFDQPVSHATESTGRSKDSFQGELEKVKQELNQALTEKAIVASKYEKLTAICRSQRQEIQDLKGALALISSQNSASQKGWTSSSGHQQLPIQVPQGGWHAFDQQPREKQSGTIWDLQEGLSPSSSSIQRNQASEIPAWQAFVESPRQMGAPTDGRRRSSQHARAASMGGDARAYASDGLTANCNSPQSPLGVSSTSSLGGATSARTSSHSQGMRPASRTQPAGWAGF